MMEVNRDNEVIEEINKEINKSLGVSDSLETNKFMVFADKDESYPEVPNSVTIGLLNDVFYGNNALIPVGETIEESFLKDGREKDWECLYLNSPVENPLADELGCRHSDVINCGIKPTGLPVG